jgi:hypothetical protein
MTLAQLTADEPFIADGGGEIRRGSPQHSEPQNPR